MCAVQSFVIALIVWWFLFTHSPKWKEDGATAKINMFIIILQIYVLCAEAILRMKRMANVRGLDRFNEIILSEASITSLLWSVCIKCTFYYNEYEYKHQ